MLSYQQTLEWKILSSHPPCIFFTPYKVKKIRVTCTEMFPELFLDEKEFLRGGMRIFPLQLDFLNGTFSLFIWACTTYKTKQKSSKPPTHRGFFLHPHMQFESIILVGFFSHPKIVCQFYKCKEEIYPTYTQGRPCVCKVSHHAGPQTFRGFQLFTHVKKN
jgi:hypothetical protein